MNDNYNRRENKRYANQELRNIDDTYVFDSASGLYKPKSYDSKEECEPQRHSVTYERPIEVKTRRDWISIIISAITLIALVIYTDYTRSIFRTSQVAAIGTIQAAWASQKAADAAVKAADSAANTMHLDEAAWINISASQTSLTDGKPILVPIEIVNDGKTTALNLKGKLVLNLLSVSEEPDLTYGHGHPAYTIDTKALTRKFPQSVKYAVLPKYLPREKPIAPVIVTPDIRKNFDDGNSYIVIHATLTYDDIFGIHHWSHFCAVFQNVTPGIQAKSGHGTCGDYNDIDRNF